MRQPAPGWQVSLDELPAGTASGCRVEHIPAGVLLRPPGSRPPQPGDPCYDVPADPDRPTVLIGGVDVPAEDLANLLAALPQATRAAVGPAPGADQDLLPVARQVTDTPGTEMAPLTDPPLIVDRPRAAPAPLVDRTGIPTWKPSAEATPADAGTSYRERIDHIVTAAAAARYDTARVLATALEREASVTHGEDSLPAIQVRQVRAHVERLADDAALAAHLYHDAALKLLALLGATAPGTEQCTSNADACWRAIRDTAEARRFAPAILVLRARVPGPNGRWLRAAERYRARLDDLAGAESVTRGL